MRKLITSLFICITTLSAFGQGQSKFDLYLFQKYGAVMHHTIDGSQVIEVLVKGSIENIKKITAQNGGVFKYSYGNIAAIRIPLSALDAFYTSPYIIRMEGAPPHMRVCNDTMRIHSHIVEVQMGQSPLPQAYKGKGIVIGMIDSGIDFVHPDFRDSTGKSRILAYWDMTKPANQFTPFPYGYGQEWDKPTLDTAIADSIPAVIASMDSASGLEYGHGTHVSGVATANGRANGLSIGAAPEASIMAVAYNFSNQSNNEMTDAVSFIFNKATAMGMPCVINASLGDYDGSHDGLDLQAQMIDSMILAQPGRVLVAASGNESNIPYHVGYTLTAGDTNFTWFAPYSYNGNIIYYDVWADSNKFKNVQYAFGADRINPFSAIENTKFYSVANALNDTIKDTIKNTSGNIIGIVYSYLSLVGSTYELQVNITPDSLQTGKANNDSSYYWRFITTGTGRVDAWYPDPTPIVNSGLPLPGKFPPIKNYKMPDTVSTLCSSFQCSPHVITVGDYYNRKSYIDYDTVSQTLYGNNVTEGQLTYYSGSGPTRDGRFKPDIVSPGDFCMSVLASPLRQLYITHIPQNVDIGGWHDYDGGTSTASPGAAGIAALYLQAFPTATADEVRNALMNCADQDSFTGVIPNNHYGYGKVDAFKAITGCPLSVTEIKAPTATLFAYPNPMKDGTVIDYDFSNTGEYCTAAIVFYDVMGRELKSMEVKTPKGTLSFSADGMASNIYFYSLVVDNKVLNTQKLEVVK